jgi:hypothetical protein
MRVSASLPRTLLLALMVTGVALPQAMLQYGAAAGAGVAAGTAAGKKASDALSAVMNQAAAAGATGDKVEKAEQDKAAKAAKNVKPEASKPEEYHSLVAPANLPAAPEASPLPVARGGSALLATTSQPRQLGASKNRKATAAPEAIEAAFVAQPAVGGVIPEEDLPVTLQLALAEIHPVLEPLATRMDRIKSGVLRDEVKRILGNPASRVTIPGERDLDEIYYYQQAGRTVATVRLEAGVVTKVSFDGI